LLRSTSELENQLIVNNKIEADVEEQEAYVSGRKREIEETVRETIHLKKLHEVAAANNAELDEQRAVAENKKDDLMRKIRVLRDVESVVRRREIEAEDKQIASLKIEAEVVKKKYSKGDKANRALYNLINFNIATRRNLCVELKTYEDESQQQKEEIRLILQEKDRYEHDVEVANQK
jgi:hypothetical protein